MVKSFSLLAVLTAALFLPGGDPRAPATAGAVYYIAPNGNDANPGTLAQPWRTIQWAANTLVAGDTVYIRAGTYSERVVPQRSGSAGQVITYAAYPGETATIDGSGVTLPDDLAGLFDISHKSYIVVSGLRVINAGPHDNNAGILVNDSSHITIARNSTYNTNSSGIGVWGSSNIIVDGNRVDEAGGGGWQECITVAGTDTFVVRNNEVLNCHKEGIDAKDGAANGQIYRNHVHHTLRVGIYVDAWDKHTYNIAVYQNLVHDIASMGFALASEQGGLLENIRLYNNIAHHSLVGLWLSACCIATHPLRDITIVNNTFAYNGQGGWGGGIGIENTQVQSVTIRNNIASQNIYSQMAADPSILPQLTVDHNLTDGDRDPEFEFSGVDDLVGVSPLFVNPLTGNYRLQPGSPAIDHGSAYQLYYTNVEAIPPIVVQ